MASSAAFGYAWGASGGALGTAGVVHCADEMILSRDKLPLVRPTRWSASGENPVFCFPKEWALDTHEPNISALRPKTAQRP